MTEQQDRGARENGRNEEPKHEILHEFEIQICGLTQLHDIRGPVLAIRGMVADFRIVKRKLLVPTVIRLGPRLSLVDGVDHF